MIFGFLLIGGFGIGVLILIVGDINSRKR